MSPARVACLGAVLDRVFWDGKPPAVHQHLHTCLGRPVWRGTAIEVVAATLAGPVPKSFVDVMRLSWPRPTHCEKEGEGASANDYVPRLSGASRTQRVSG